MTRLSARRLSRGGRAAMLLLVTVAAGCAIRLAAQAHSPRFGSDSFHYLLLARSVLSGEGFVSGGSQHPDLSRSPLLPLLIAASSLFSGNVDAAALFAVALCGALVVVPLFFLARGMFGPGAALAVLPLSTLSCLVGLGLKVYPTSPYVLLYISAAALGWFASSRSRRLLPAAGGAVAGAAALARPDGLFLPLSLAAWLVLSPLLFRPPAAALPARTGRRRMLLEPTAGALAVLLAAGAVYAPYALWASGRLGRWSPVPGLEYVRDMRMVTDRLGLRDLERPGLTWQEWARFLLTSERSGFVLERYFLERTLDQPHLDSPDGPAELENPAQPGPFREVVARRLNIIGHNLRNLAYTLYGSHFLPVVPAVLFVIGLIGSLPRRKRRRAILFLSFILMVALAPLASHVEARFLYLPFSIAMIVAAAGWARVARRSHRLAGGRRIGELLAHAVLIVLVAVSGARHLAGAEQRLEAEAFQRRIAGEASRRLPPGPMLARTPYIPYWAGRPYRPLPMGSPETVLQYARSQRASSLLLEGDRDLLIRPRLEDLLRDPPPAGFVLIFDESHPAGGRLLLFEIEQRE